MDKKKKKVLPYPMTEMPVTLLRLWKVFWAYSWRSVVYALIFFVAVFVGFIALVLLAKVAFFFFGDVPIIQEAAKRLFKEGDSLIYRSEQPSFLYYALIELLEQIIMIPFAILAFKRVSKLKFKDFSLAFVSENDLKKTKHVLKFWFAWWGWSILIIYPLMLVLYNLSEMNRVLLGSVLSIAIDMVILRIFLKRSFSNFRVMLIPNSKGID